MVSKDSQRLSKKLAMVIEESKKTVVLDIMDNLLKDTPKDTHHAVSNWVPSIGSPYTEVDGSKENVSTAAQNDGLAEIQGLGKARDLKGRFVAREVYIANNVPYIAQLNQGSSTQATSGFVERAVKRGGGSI